MELTFNNINNKWVAEFEAAAHFNPHLEKEAGSTYLYKSTGGNFVIVDTPYWSDNTVIDYDVYVDIPKRYKVESRVLPTVAVVTFNK